MGHGVKGVIAIDPGSRISAFVMLDRSGNIVTKALKPNEIIIEYLADLAVTYPGEPLVIEKIESYGMAVGATVFDTVFWTGRFWQRWLECGQECAYRMPRKEVKMHLCGQMRAKDGNIRQALIDRYGPSRREAMGTKKAPGPLYGVSKDLWAALAVGVTWLDSLGGLDAPTGRTGAHTGITGDIKA
jgi:hypothetical protein